MVPKISLTNQIMSKTTNPKLIFYNPGTFLRMFMYVILEDFFLHKGGENVNQFVNVYQIFLVKT